MQTEIKPKTESTIYQIVFQPSIAKNLVLALEKIQDEITDLIEELEILSYEELMKDLQESIKDFEEGRYYTLKSEEDIDSFFEDLEK